MVNPLGANLRAALGTASRRPTEGWEEGNEGSVARRRLVIRTVLIGLGLLVSPRLWAIGAAPASAPAADPPAAPRGCRTRRRGAAHGRRPPRRRQEAHALHRRSHRAASTSAIFTLADPYRIVVDLPEVHFQLPERYRRGGAGALLGLPLRHDLAGQVADRARRDRSRCGSTSPSSCRRPTSSRRGSSSTWCRRPAQVFLDTNRAYRENQAIEAVGEARPRAALAAAEAARRQARSSSSIPATAASTWARAGVGGTVEKDVTLAFAKVLGAEARRHRALRRPLHPNRRQLHRARRSGRLRPRPPRRPVRLDPRQLVLRRRRCAATIDLHRLREGLRQDGRRDRRDREQVRRARRHRHRRRRDRRGEGHPPRPDPAGDAEFRRRLRPQPGQGTRDQDPHVQGSAPAGELQGAGGAGRALGA